jgi:hypothetical protein
VGRQGASREQAAGQAVRLSDRLSAFAQNLATERVELSAIVTFIGRRSAGGLLLVFAAPLMLPVPMPGVAAVFGVPLMVISAQLLLGRRHIWLPARLAHRSIARTEFAAIVERARPTLRRLELIARPRVGWLAGEWTIVPIGAICLLLAVIITLPVPFGHMLPGAAISLLALGLLERDGLVVGLGLVVALVAIGLLLVAADGAAEWLHAQFG